jgi:NDP-mannose synthase
MKALILAGGKGQRLRPYTTIIPKPLMPVGDMPILELLLRQLRGAGVTEVILAVNHLRELIEAFFGDGRNLGLKVTYAFEDKPLGTAGPIASVLEQLPERFFVLNGDLLTTLSLARLWEAHCASDAAATIAAHTREVKVDFGILERAADGRLAGYLEKPTHRYEVSMGCYVLTKAAVQPHCIQDRYMDMPDLMRALVAAGQRVNCYNEPCFWLDIGRAEDYQLANEIIEREPEKFHLDRHG